MIIGLIVEGMDEIKDIKVCEYCINKEFYCDDGSKCKENIKQYFEKKATNDG